MNDTAESNPTSSDDETRRVTKVIFSLTATLAIVGNLLVLLLFLRFPSWLRKKHYQCILNLAVTDILTAISLLVVPKFVQDEDAYDVPLDYSSREFYCRIVWSHFIPFSMGIISVYTCVVLAVERWLAVMRPIVYRERFTVRMMHVLILCCWIAGFAFESPILPRVEGYQDAKSASAQCKWTVETNKRKAWTLAILVFAGQTFIPCCLIVLAYLHIFIRFKDERMFSLSTRTSLTNSSESSSKHALKRATVMMAVSSLALVVCWMPNQMYFFLAQLGYFELKPSIAVRVVGVLVFSNCWMNPIIYGFMNKNFRKGYRALIVPCLKR